MLLPSRELKIAKRKQAAAIRSGLRYINASYTADRQDLQWCLRESIWLAVCSRVALQI